MRVTEENEREERLIERRGEESRVGGELSIEERECLRRKDNKVIIHCDERLVKLIRPKTVKLRGKTRVNLILIMTMIVM